MKSGAEIKVGVVVVLALVVLGLMLYYLIGVQAGRRGFTFDVVFDRAEVQAGNAVALAGVTVGRVESVELTRDNRALVRLRLQPGVTVRRGYRITITPGALLGEKYVEITPVPERQAGPPLRSGARVKGQSGVGFQEMMTDAQELIGRLNEAVGSITALVKDQKIRRLVEESIVGMSQAARDTSELARTLSATAAETGPRLRAALKNMEGVTQDLRAASHRLAQVASETEIPAQLEETARRLNSIVQRVDDIAAQFQEMANNPELKDSAAIAARNLRGVSESIRQAGDNLRVASISIAQGAGAVPEISENARQASADIRDAAAEFKGMVRETRQAVSGVSGRAAEAARAIGELPQVRAEINAGAQYLTRDGRWWVDANLDLRSGDRLLRLGVADIGEAEHYNVQLGQRLGPGRLRYGLVESEVGLGYDWLLSPQLTLSAEAFDPDDVQANLFGFWGLGGSLRGWSAVAGYRHLGGDGSPAIGMRRER